MKIVGIDYSLCSPCVAFTGMDCAYEAHFLTGTRRHAGACTHACTGVYAGVGAGTLAGGRVRTYGHAYPDWTAEEERHDKLSEWALGFCKDADLVVIEDYAMGAKGRVFHIGENAGLLKWKLWQAGVKFTKVSPTLLKKFAAGKGNADKDRMHQAFLERFGIDLKATMTPDASKVGNPVSDIVDAIFLCLYGESLSPTR